MPPLQDRYLEVGGLRIRYWEAGIDGPNLVLIHGLGGAVEVWRRVLAPLARHHRVVALDLPGCGRSQSPPAYPADTLGFFAATVLGLMDALGMTTARLIGSSLGGAVALEIAIRAPARAECLILANSAGFSHDVAWPLRLMSVPGVGEVLTRPGREHAALALRSCVADPACITEEDIDQAYALAILPGAQAAFLGMLRVYCSVLGVQRATLHRLAHNIPAITAPVLVVWGDCDAIIPIQSAARAVALLPRSALAVFHGAGHLIFVEEPARFVDLAEQFLVDPDAVLAAYRQTPLDGHRRTLWGAHLLERVGPALTPQRVAVGIAGLALLAAAPRVVRRMGSLGGQQGASNLPGRDQTPPRNR